MEAFDRNGVSFVSVTQQFNTTSSMGRLTLNILLSFAQFEREIIGERIRDKIAAQKRKGKWAGGVPVLGYDVARSGPSPRLVVNAKEAARVREIFQMYLDKGSLLPVVKELGRREWTNKRRITKKGMALGGRPFDKATLYQTLTNPIYLGKIVHKSATYDGEHEAIISAETFDQVQTLLKTNGRTGGVEVRNKYGALLRGLLRCKSCGHAMTHTFTGGRNSRSYRYYRCVKAIKSGSDECPSGTLPGAEIERVVVDEVRALATDRALLARVLTEAQATVEADLAALTTERGALAAERQRHDRELRDLATNGASTVEVSARIAELHERIADADKRLPVLEARIAELSHESIGREEAEAAFRDFDQIWQNLIPREQARLLKLLIATVEYDAKNGSVAVTFRPTSIRALIAQRLEEAA
jgi:site-specific DNA recombinase